MYLSVFGGVGRKEAGNVILLQAVSSVAPLSYPGIQNLVAFKLVNHSLPSHQLTGLVDRWSPEDLSRRLFVHCLLF